MGRPVSCDQLIIALPGPPQPPLWPPPQPPRLKVRFTLLESWKVRWTLSGTEQVS